MSKRLIGVNASENERTQRAGFLDLFKHNPLPDEEVMNHLSLFINRQSMSQLLFMHDIYKKILDVNGIIIEFGARFGKHLAMFECFRGIYEPYNYTRRIVGFDTFEGFTQTHEKDGKSHLAKEGLFPVAEGYVQYLEELLAYHESESPLSHIKKFELIQGDAVETFSEYTKNHPELIVSLVVMDMDIYTPTKKCLEMVEPYLTKGSVIVFDVLNNPHFPGESVALSEVWGLNKYKIQRVPYVPFYSYIVYE